GLLEWRWESHLDLWLERSRNRRPRTRISSRHHAPAFRVQMGPARVGDFAWQIRGGRAVISVAAPVNFQEGRRSFFPFRRVGARGCARSFVRISASAMVLDLPCGQIAMINSVFPA